MIHIKDKKDCCGCTACVQRCPKQCITMVSDNEGFLYPIVDDKICIECGLCEKVCPVVNQEEPRKPKKVYAAYNKDEEVRVASSSGGIFTLLAEEIIKKGGVIFGVKFDKNWMATFDYTETFDGITPFRGSKYVQADIGNAYKQAEEFLKQGREVLFSGTPCQIAGLRRFLRKKYDNLLTVDIMCHGVPSPKIWSWYLEEICNKLIATRTKGNSKVHYTEGADYKSYIEAINFRSKINGWKRYCLSIKLNLPTKDENNTISFIDTLDKNSYMRAYLDDIILRPSCHKCPAKKGKSHSDITIADFWGINVIDPAFDDDKGCGLIFSNTMKGLLIFNEVSTVFKEKRLYEGIKYNTVYYKNSKPHPNRNKFFDTLDDAESIECHIYKINKLSFKHKILRIINICIDGIMRRIKR